jgi:glycine dehydrogenase
VLAAAADAGVDLGTVDADHVRVACDETTTDAHLAVVLTAFGVADPVARSRGGRARSTGRARCPRRCRPVDLRDDAYLTHPVFHQHRTETSMLRFLRRLADATTRSTAG